jgi:hypothetical protein
MTRFVGLDVLAGDNDEIFGAPPRKAASSHEIGQSLDDLSVQEIDERITLKSHGSKKREEPNKHLSAPPPPFLSSTFAKLVEVFDRRGVSFVSTTLPNATRSAGGHRRPP